MLQALKLKDVRSHVDFFKSEARTLGAGGSGGAGGAGTAESKEHSGDRDLALALPTLLQLYETAAQSRPAAVVGDLQALGLLPDDTAEMETEDGSTGAAKNVVLEDFSRVEARYEGDLTYYPGTVVKVHSDDTFDVQYDDGDFESKVRPVFLS